jgi:transcriptional regulator with XRE-family HTH domain
MSINKVNPLNSNPLAKDVLQISYIAKFVGKNIVRLRGKMGVTQETLSEESGVEISTIRAYERGEQNPDINVLETLACAFYKLAQKSVFKDVRNLIRNGNNFILFITEGKGDRNKNLIAAQIYDDRFYNGKAWFSE